jgi:hypothetical protein
MGCDYADVRRRMTEAGAPQQRRASPVEKDNALFGSAQAAVAQAPRRLPAGKMAATPFQSGCFFLEIRIIGLPFRNACGCRLLMAQEQILR